MYIKENFVAVPAERYEELIELESRVAVLVDFIFEDRYEDELYLKVLGFKEEAEAYKKMKEKKDAELHAWLKERNKEEKNEVDG